MLNAWIGRRAPLRRESQIKGTREYREIEADFKVGAEFLKIPATYFQATLWLVWKRINRIVYSAQLSFVFEEAA